MKTEIVLARVVGCWQTMHAAVRTALVSKWAPFSLACGLIVAVSLSLWSIIPFGLETLWLAAPMTLSAILVSWALFWPMNCATWFGWIGMLFRLIGVLALSNLVWVLVAVAR